MGRFNDLTGMKFGRLTVMIRAPTINKATRWLCKCDCGNEKNVSCGSLRSGRVCSCGCLRIEATISRRRKHGMRSTPIYNVWCAMRARCHRPTATHYADYGGRGITVCDEWRSSFETFRDWAFANGYSRGLSIDRIDNDKGYCPDNCRWADSKQQARNRRTKSKYAEQLSGATITEVAERVGIAPHVLWSRLKQNLQTEKLFYNGNLSLKESKELFENGTGKNI